MGRPGSQMRDPVHIYHMWNLNAPDLDVSASPDSRAIIFILNKYVQKKLCMVLYANLKKPTYQDFYVTFLSIICGTEHTYIGGFVEMYGLRTN